MACRKKCVYRSLDPQRGPFEKICDGKAECPTTYHDAPLESEVFIPPDPADRVAAGSLGAGLGATGGLAIGLKVGAIGGPLGALIGGAIGLGIGLYLSRDPCP